MYQVLPGEHPGEHGAGNSSMKARLGLSARLRMRHQGQLALATKTFGVSKDSGSLSNEGTELRKSAKFAPTDSDKAGLYRHILGC